jgi:xylitol oxidase
MSEQNWGGNVRYDATEVIAPSSMSELAVAIDGAAKVRALGSRHSFNRIADADTIIDTRSLPEFLELSMDRTTVTVNGSMTYGRLVELLAPLNLAVHNLASLPHISIAGAIATGTHGSGDRNGNLATAVAGLRIMTASGDVVTPKRGEEDFDGTVVSLGALGVVTAVTLDTEPAFQIEQRVYDGPSLADAAACFDEIFSAAYSVSIFTHWQGMADQIWVKHRVGQPLSAVFDGFAPAVEKRHPIRAIDPEACTDQFGVAGLWADRLPHFKMDFTPSAGEEIQSEFFVARVNAVEAIAAIDAISGQIADVLLTSELRTIRSDELWMSPHIGRETLACHFTWHPDQAKAEEAARLVGDAIAHLTPRAHWGKLYDPAQFDLAQFERLDDFLQLVQRADPQAKFQNNWFDRTFR